MALLRVDTRPLLPRLRAELVALLASLPDGGPVEWATGADAEIAHALAEVKAILG